MAINPKVKLWLVAGLVLIIPLLSLAGGLFNLLQKERAKNLALQEQLADVTAQQKTTEAKLDDSRKMISTLEAKLQDSEGRLEMLTSEVQQEKIAKQQALSQAEQLKADLQQQQALKADLENKLIEKQKDAQKLEAQLKELESKKAELETRIKDMEAQKATSQSVELGTVVISSETTPQQEAVPPSPKAKQKKAAVPKKAATPATKSLPASQPQLEGKVLVVNKDYNFAVINLGAKDGLGLGDEFSVYHDNKYLGDLKVEKVHDAMAAVGFISDGIKDKISEGDKVVPKNK